MLLQTLRRSTIEFTPSVQTLPTKQGCRGESDMKVLFFLTLALDPSDQGRCEGETVANEQHQSFTRTLRHCEARPTPQRPQRVLKGNLLGRFLRSRGIRK